MPMWCDMRRCCATSARYASAKRQTLPSRTRSGPRGDNRCRDRRRTTPRPHIQMMRCSVSVNATADRVGNGGIRRLRSLGSWPVAADPADLVGVLQNAIRIRENTTRSVDRGSVCDLRVSRLGRPRRSSQPSTSAHSPCLRSHAPDHDFICLLNIRRSPVISLAPPVSTGLHAALTSICITSHRQAGTRTHTVRPRRELPRGACRARRELTSLADASPLRRPLRAHSSINITQAASGTSRSPRQATASRSPAARSPYSHPCCCPRSDLTSTRAT